MTMTSATSTFDSDADLVRHPPEFVERYRAEGLWASRTIPEEFRRVADANPDRPAVVTGAEAITYAELDRRSDAIAVGLRAAGLSSGDRVLVQLINNAEALVSWYGLMKAGLIPIASLAQHGPHEIAELARQAEPVAHLIQADFPSQDLVALARETAAHSPSLRFLLTLGDGEGASGLSLEDLVAAAPAADSARSEVEAVQSTIPSDGLAVLQLSGGTTSVPKLIPRLHTEYWYNSVAWARAAGIDPDSCVAHLLPVIHNAGIVCAVHAAHAVGAAVAVGAPTATGFAALAANTAITHTLMTRPIVALIDADTQLRESLRTLKVIHWADRTVPAEVVETFESETCRVGQMFGMGEGLCMATPLDAPASVRHTTNGAPVSPLDEVRVLEPGTEEPAQPGEPGEFCARGPYTIRGYFRAADRNAVAFTSDGFYRTGDIVREISHGERSYYRLEDRIKDLINRGGEKINAQEVEELLVRHPAVERAAVVAMPDERLGERSCAFVVASPDRPAPTLEEVATFLADLGVAKFKWPERIEARDHLPLTNIDKVHKVVLRQEITDLLLQERVSG